MRPMYPGHHVLGYVMGPYGPMPVGAGVGRRRYGRRRMHGVGYSPGRPYDPYSLGQAATTPAAIPEAVYHGMMAPNGACLPMCPPPGPQIANELACPTMPGYTPGISMPIPNWRPGMLAPGLPAPQEGKVPIAMRPVTTNIFTVATSGGRLVFNARPQKPFRATRLLLTANHLPDPAVPGGPTTPATVIGQVFVGTDPQQGSLDDLSLETIGSPTAFGTGQVFIQAEPGIDFTVNIGLSNLLVVPNESVVVRIDLMGDWVS